jgi:hypothetical protein
MGNWFVILNFQSRILTDWLLDHDMLISISNLTALVHKLLEQLERLLVAWDWVLPRTELMDYIWTYCLTTIGT